MLKIQPSELLDRGWYLLPVAPNSKEPFTKFAHRGFYSASNDLSKIKSWLDREPKLNWGVACEMSGLIVFDFDFDRMDHEADEWHHKFDSLYYEDSYVVETGNGIHYYFKAPKDLQVAGKLANGIDIKYRGYVVTEGSTHANGKVYQALKSNEPLYLPQSLLERVAR